MNLSYILLHHWKIKMKTIMLKILDSARIKLIIHRHWQGTCQREFVMDIQIINLESYEITLMLCA